MQVHVKAVPRVFQIREVIARMVLDLAGKEIGADEPLMSAGLNSLASTELKSAIDATFGLDLPGTVVYDYPSIGALATLVHSELGGGTEVAGPGTSAAGLELRRPYTASGRVLVVVTHGWCSPRHRVPWP
jgi:acyl carrier protein